MQDLWSRRGRSTSVGLLEGLLVGPTMYIHLLPGYVKVLSG